MIQRIRRKNCYTPEETQDVHIPRKTNGPKGPWAWEEGGVTLTDSPATEQPSREAPSRKKGDDAGKFRVEVHGFDYYNTKTGTLDSGGDEKIAMWMLDPDYDGRSIFPRQVFFPMAGEKDGWSKLAKNLKAEIDEELIEAYRGTISLPFKAGDNKRAAVTIIDDRGIESLKIIGLA